MVRGLHSTLEIVMRASIQTEDPMSSQCGQGT